MNCAFNVNGLIDNKTSSYSIPRIYRKQNPRKETKSFFKLKKKLISLKVNIFYIFALSKKKHSPGTLNTLLLYTLFQKI